MELASSLNTNFTFGGHPPPTVPQIDLTGALNGTDLTFNINLDQNDTVAFSSFARAIQMANRLTLRRPQYGDPEETTLIEAFLYAERLFYERAITDPRIPYLFAGLLVRLDDYDYALDCLRNFEAMLAMHSTDVTSAISETQRLHANRVRESHQALSQLKPSKVGWAYSATSCAPLPNTLAPIQVPIVQFAPFTLDQLSENELGRLLRSISVQTSVIEGVLKLSAGESETLITLGFESSTFSHAFPPNMPKEYIQQVLLDSQAATQFVLDRIGSANAKFDKAFVCELHKLFTKTACIATQRVGEEVRSVYIGRGRYKFLSNHVFARNGAYHIYCRPEEVSAEMEKIFGMLGNYLTNTQQTLENGIWLAAWFHHRFVNIHPFRDGNGRVTRALVSAILLRFGLLPFLVTVEDKGDYFHALMAADADASNLAPLAKFMARQQLQAFFLCKTEELPIFSTAIIIFRRLRIEEAHMFIQRKASDVSTTYNRTVNLINRAPSLTVHLHDYHILELVPTDVVDLLAIRRIFLIYGSLFPLETDIFAFYIVTPCAQNNNVASVRSVTGVLYNQAIDVWETTLRQFLMSDLDEVLMLVARGR